MADAIARDGQVQSIRAIEAASGLSRETVFTYLPAQGETSYGLLHCADKGSENSYEDRHEGVYSVTGEKPNPPPTSRSRASSTGEVLPPAVLAERSKNDSSQGVRDPAGVLAEGRKRLLDPRVSAALDPSRDTWAPRSRLADELDYVGAGHRGWALGVLLGLQDVSLRLADVRELLGLSERQTRAVVAQLEDAGLARRSSLGRETIVEFRFDSVLVRTFSDFFRESSDRRERAHHKELRSVHERKIMASRRTLHGKHAWALIRHPNPAWSPENAAFHCRQNELIIASMYERGFTRSWAKAA
jgi:hypothetical protein